MIRDLLFEVAQNFHKVLRRIKSMLPLATLLFFFNLTPLLKNLLHYTFKHVQQRRGKSQIARRKYLKNKNSFHYHRFNILEGNSTNPINKNIQVYQVSGKRFLYSWKIFCESKISVIFRFLFRYFNKPLF